MRNSLQIGLWVLRVCGAFSGLVIDVTGPNSQWAMLLLGQVVLVGIRRQAEPALESKPVSSTHSSVLPLLLARPPSVLGRDSQVNTFSSTSWFSSWCLAQRSQPGQLPRETFTPGADGFRSLGMF